MSLGAEQLSTIVAVAREWYESRRNAAGNVNRNVMAAGIAVSRLLRTTFPLSVETLTSNKGSQVRGLSGRMIAEVLAAHGETRGFAAEGGRTSRGTLGHALALADALTDAMHAVGPDPTDEDRTTVAIALEGYFVSCIQADYLDRQMLKVELDCARPVARIVADILHAARLRADSQTGAVAQHLVGAKLELRFPERLVGRDRATAADLQTNRQGDFQIGSTALHVTMSPMAKLCERCRENLAQSLRSFVLVPEGKVAFARGLFESEGLDARVNVQSIESFVGTNIEELAQYDSDGIRLGVAHLIRQYNERIREAESDQSLRIEEPQWMLGIFASIADTW